MAITHGLDQAHIGAICDALTAAGVDPTVWSARAVNDKLNADMRTRGMTWPDHIANPGAFLHSRLRRLSWSPPETPTKASGSAAASIDQTPQPVVLTAASRARIAAARDEIRRVLAKSTQRTRDERTTPNPYAHDVQRLRVGLPLEAPCGRGEVRPVAAWSTTRLLSEVLRSPPASAPTDRSANTVVPTALPDWR